MDKRIRLYDINWDTDGVSIDDLPEEVVIPAQEIVDQCDIENLEECIRSYDSEFADYLSDAYGFCVNTFRVEIIK